MDREGWPTSYEQTIAEKRGLRHVTCPVCGALGVIRFDGHDLRCGPAAVADADASGWLDESTGMLGCAPPLLQCCCCSAAGGFLVAPHEPSVQSRPTCCLPVSRAARREEGTCHRCGSFNRVRQVAHVALEEAGRLTGRRWARRWAPPCLAPHVGP